MSQGQLPKLPSLAELGITTKQTQASKASDGKKKVPYNAVRPRSVRPFQSRQPEGSKWSKTYPNLKITPHGEAIAKLIEQLPILAVDAPTGMGKTRYIPYLMATKGYRVRVTVPTTVAARDAYRFQIKYTTLKVGFAAGREVHYSDSDQLVYVTTGHLTQRIMSMIKNRQRREIPRVLGDILIIDEVHASTCQITLLIGLLRYLYTDKTGKYTGPKIVFSTATFNHGDIVDHFPEFPVYQIEGENKPITDIFLTEPRNPLKDDPNPEIERIVREELNRWRQLPPSEKRYHGIVFRPGVQEVEETIEYLERRFDLTDPVVFFPAYSQLSPAEIDEIFAPQPEKMKVIVGTNIIESSITIEDAGFVIDDMTEKIPETSATGGYRIVLSVISQAARMQRRGRIGRTIAGRAYALITEQQFRELPPFRLREIDRIPIYDIVLQLIDAGLSPRDVLKISINRYDQARRTLLQLGMIENRADRYFVTDAGRFVSTIPLSIQNAYMIYLAYRRFLQNQRNNLSAERILFRTIIAVASMLEVFGPSFMFVPRKTREQTQVEYNAMKEAYIEKYHRKFKGPTDIHTLTNIFWEMIADIQVMKSYGQATNYKYTNYIREWSVRNSMNNKKLKEFWIVMRDVESIVESKLSSEPSLKDSVPKSGFNLGRDLPDGGYTVLGNIAAETFAKAYIANRLVRDVGPSGVQYLDRQTGISYRINQSTSFNSMVITSQEGPEEIVAGQIVEVVGKGGGVIHLAGLIVSNEYFPDSLR